MGWRVLSTAGLAVRRWSWRLAAPGLVAIAALGSASLTTLVACGGGGAAAVRAPALTDEQRLVRLVDELAVSGLVLGDPLALPPEVLALAEDEIGIRGTVAERLSRLAAWLVAEDGVGFRYDALQTRTAAQAWATRSGDCLSYAHLLHAMARHLRVPMQYVRFRAPRGYEERGGQLVVVTHVASLYDLDRETILVDLGGDRANVMRSDYQRLAAYEAMALHASNLAMAELGRGEAAVAERLLRVLLTHAPQLPDLHNNLGAVLLHRQRYAEALRVLQQAIERFPTYVSLYVNGALAARAAGRPKLAQQLSDRAEAPWTDPFVPFVRAAQLLEEGRAAEGVEILQRVVKLAPGSATFQVHLARGLFALGKPVEAQAAFARAAALDPRNPLLVPLALSLGLPP